VSINSRKNAFLNLKGDLVDDALGGLPRCGVSEEVEEEEGVYPKIILLNLSFILSQMALVLSRLNLLSLGICTQTLLSLLLGVG
jgi:hypothetical protein